MSRSSISFRNIPPQEPEKGIQPRTNFAGAIIQQLAALGAQSAFGVVGGAIGVLYDALITSPVQVYHCQHETGAGYAAAHAYFTSGRPSILYLTTGPGLLNGITGITAARWDGAKLIVVSGATNATHRGRWASQETSSYTLPQDMLYAQGRLFDFAIRVEDVGEMAEVVRRIANGLSRPGPFIAHVCLPLSLQSAQVDRPRPMEPIQASSLTPSADDVRRCAELLDCEDFVIWIGHGASRAAHLVRALIEKTGAPVICSPRGKGIVPEDDPRFIGVTGLGGHDAVTRFLTTKRPRWMLVLGSRLGEATSFWDRDLEPSHGFIHVDIDPCAPGVAYPDRFTIGIQADASNFLAALLPLLTGKQPRLVPVTERRFDFPETGDPQPGLVRPQALMRGLQRCVIDQSDAPLLSESGNSFAWCNHFLRFNSPDRYRVSALFGAMGTSAAGVVGAALARKGKAVAVVGDGSMLMNAEINTAVHYGAQAVWVVLNDARYGMCVDGQRTLGLSTAELTFPRVDFVTLARAQGADGLRVDREEDVEAALAAAMAARGPFVVDVQIDPREVSPLLRRFESLRRQGSGKSVAGWEAGEAKV